MANLNQRSLDEIKVAALEAYPKEACGVIVAGPRKPVVVVCRNSHSDPENQFLIAREDLDFVKANFGSIVAIWHSHTDQSADPSEIDKSACEASGIPWFIVSVQKRDETFEFGGPVCLHPTGYKAPYNGRPYAYGVFDCYSLVCDFYEREFGLNLNRDYERIDDWWITGHDFFSRNFEREGFVNLIGQEPKHGDVFVIQASSDVGSHVAIYLGDDRILHHCIGRLSSTDIYGGYWEKHTIKHLRHKSKC